MMKKNITMHVNEEMSLEKLIKSLKECGGSHRLKEFDCQAVPFFFFFSFSDFIKLEKGENLESATSPIQSSYIYINDKTCTHLKAGYLLFNYLDNQIWITFNKRNGHNQTTTYNYQSKQRIDATR